MLRHCDEMPISVYRVSAVHIVYDKFAAYIAGFNWSFTCMYVFINKTLQTGELFLAFSIMVSCDVWGCGRPEFCLINYGKLRFRFQFL